MDTFYADILKNKQTNSYNNQLNIPDQLLEIYKIPSKLRSQKNIEYLYQYCRNHVAFEKIKKKYEKGDLMYKEILSRVEFHIYPAGKIIYFPKDAITNMFFIFEGKVNVYKNSSIYRASAKSSTRIEKILNKKLLNIKTNYKENKIEPKKLIFDDDDEKNNNNNNKFFKRRTNRAKTSKKLIFHLDKLTKKLNNNLDYVLEKGESYGEDSLKKEEREVLVEANTNCIIGFLSLFDYSLVFEKTELLEKQDTINFMKKIYIFKDTYSLSILNDFFEKGKIIKLSMGQFLFKKGDLAKNLYIIKSGRFRLFFNSKITISTDYDLSDFDLKNNFNTIQTKNFKYELKKFYIDKNDYNMLSIGEGDLIGDVEYYLNKENNIFYAQCETKTAQVIEISYDLFNQRVTGIIKGKLKNNAKNKVEFYEKRYKIIKSVNKKKIDKNNKFKEIIIDKLDKQNEQYFPKMVKNKSKKNIHIKNLRKILYSLPKIKTLNEDSKNNHKPLNHMIQTSQVFNSTKFSTSNIKCETIPNLSITKNKKSFLDNEKLVNLDNRNKRSILTETNRKNFCNCFGINKRFYMKNNARILKKKLSTILMSQKN